MDDLVRLLDNYITLGEQGAKLDLTSAALRNAGVVAMGQIKDELMASAEAAIEATPELNYGPLRERLLENLANDQHYYFSPDLSTIEVFDERFAGSHDDLLAGQVAGGGGGDDLQQRRLFCWKYGIYMPGREGSYRSKRFDDYPSYADVIDARLDAWGDKAPYWYFLEWGNSGGSPAYPSFSGTGFISNVLARVKGIVASAIDVASREFEADLDYAIEYFFEHPEEKPRVELGYIPLGITTAGQKYGVSVRTKGVGIYYQLRVGGRFVRSISPGEQLPGGGAFRP